MRHEWSILAIILLLFISLACNSQEKVKLCEEENPAFDPAAECEKIIKEKYPTKQCSYTFGPTQWLPMGSCRDCIIRCQ